MCAVFTCCIQIEKSKNGTLKKKIYFLFKKIPSLAGIRQDVNYAITLLTVSCLD